MIDQNLPRTGEPGSPPRHGRAACGPVAGETTGSRPARGNCRGRNAGGFVHQVQAGAAETMRHEPGVRNALQMPSVLEVFGLVCRGRGPKMFLHRRKQHAPVACSRAAGFGFCPISGGRLRSTSASSASIRTATPASAERPRVVGRRVTKKSQWRGQQSLRSADPHEPTTLEKSFF